MKLRLLLASLALGILLPGRIIAAEAAPSSPAADLKDLQTRINAKDRAGKTQPADFADEFAAFDTLLAKYHDQKTEDVAEISLEKAVAYWEIVNDDATTRKHFLAVTTDFPGTRSALQAASIVHNLDTLAALAGKPAPELHFNWSSTGKLTTLSALKGKIVVLDFWATWCGPCIRSFPQLREHVAHYKDSPVVFLGVTSIQGVVANLEAKRIDTKGDPAREMSLMPAFIKAKEMTWPVAISEEAVFNPDFGISSIPFVAIIGPDGIVRHAGLNPGDKKADIAGKIDALLKELNSPAPVTKS